MKNELRRMLRRNYRKILLEEVENREYDYRRITTDVADDGVMDPLEDAWAGGQNLHRQLDHAEAYGSEPNVRGVETLRITESQLRSIIRDAIYEAVDQDDDGDNDFADVMIARMVKSGKSKKDAIAHTKNKSYNEEDDKEEDLLVEPDINPDREDQEEDLDEYSAIGGISGYVAPMGRKRG